MAMRLSQFLNSQSQVEDKPGEMRLADFMSMNRKQTGDPESQFDAAGFFQISDQQKEEWTKMGPIGYMEAAQRVDKSEMLPVWGAIESITKTVGVKNAVDRIKADNYEYAPGQKAKDLQKVNNFLYKMAEEQVRGVSLGGKIITGASELPAFMVEFMATGGLASMGKEGVKQTVKYTAKNGLRGIVKSSVKKAAMRTAGATAGAVLRTTVGMPHRVIEQYNERHLNSQMTLTDKGYQFLDSAQEKPFTSLMKAYGDIVIENLSEVSGPTIGKLTKRLFAAKAATLITAAWKRLHPSENITKLFTKIGYDGFLEEMGEERLGDLLRAVTGVDNFGADDGAGVFDRVMASIPNAEELMVEAGVLAIPGAARATGSQAVALYRQRVKNTPKEKRPANIQINEKTGEPIDTLDKALTEKEIKDQMDFMFREREKQLEEGKVDKIASLEKKTPQTVRKVIDSRLEKEIADFEKKEERRVTLLDKAKIELNNIEATISEITAIPEYSEAGQQIFEGKQEILKSLREDKNFYQEKIKSLGPIEKRMTEKKALEDKISTFKRGVKQGQVITKQQVKEVQQDVINMIDSSMLNANDKAKFIKSIKNIQTIDQLEKNVPEIERRISSLENKAFFRTTKLKIKKELKDIKPTKQSGKPVGKFTPETQRILDKLSEASKLTKTEAQARALANVEKFGDRMPTAEEALENRMLTLIGGFDESADPEFLRDLLDEVQTIKATGRAGKLLRDFANAERFDQMRKDAIDSIIGSKPLESTTKENRESQLKDSIKSFFIGNYGWNDKMDFLSQDDKTSKQNESRLSQMARVDREIQAEKGGIRKNGEKVVDMISRAFEFKGNRRSKERQMLKQLRSDSRIINLGNFTNRRGEYIKFEVSKAQARKLWMELQDPTLRETLTGEEQVASGFAEIRGNAYSQEMINALNTFLTKEDKNFALEQLKFYRDYWKTVNKSYNQRYGVDLPFNDFYSPIRRKNYNTESGNEFLQDVGIRRSVASGSLRMRVSNLRPIALQNDVEALQRHIIDMEHFKAWAAKIQDLNAIFNGDVRETIKRKYGNSIMKSIDFHIQNFTTGGVEKAKGFEKILEVLRINFTQAALAIKPALTLKQMVSFVAYADEIPTIDFARGIAEFMTDPIGKSKILIEGSELFKNRGKDFTRDVKDAYASEEFSALRKVPSFKNMLMFTTRWGDQGAILLGGWSVYSHSLRQGKSHEEAIADFERATASAQQSGDLDQLSDWQRGGPLAKMFTMFTSSQNQYFRKEVGAIRNLLKGRLSAPKAAKKILIYHFILPMFFQWVSDFGKWDEDEQLRAAVLGSFNGIFILKDMLDTIVRLGIKGFKDSDIGVFNSEVEAFEFAKGVYKAMQKIDPNDIWMEDIIEASKDLSKEAIGPAFGLPIKQIFNGAEALEDLGEGDTAEGVLKLGGWSPYIVEKNIDKPGVF